MTGRERDIETQLKILAQYQEPSWRFWYTAVRVLAYALMDIATAIRERDVK